MLFYRSRRGTIIKTGNVLESSTGTDTDARLVALTQEGDVGAFGELVNRHERAIYAIVSRMVYSHDDTDDIVQDIFFTAYKAINSFKFEAAFSTWLYRIAVNTAIKQMKRAKVRQATSIDDPVTGLNETLVSSNGDSPETSAHRRERDEAVRKAIESLPDKHRIVVILHYFQDMSCDEIANIVGCSVGTVWSRLHYACKKLQGQLDWLAGES